MTIITVQYTGKVPAKSNRYRMDTRAVKKGGKPRLVPETEVVQFEKQLTRLFIEAMPRQVLWAIPPGRKRLKAVDPIYPKGIKVTVSINLLSIPGKGCDPDNALKAILDSATKAGVWADDNNNNIKQITITNQSLTDLTKDQAGFIMSIYEYRQPLTCPSPLARRSIETQQNVGPKLPDPVPTTFCDLCDVAMGPHCQQEEIWVLPKRVHKKIKCLVICGSCADEANLDFRYRVIDIKRMQTLRRFQIGQILQAAITDIITRKEDNGVSTTKTRTSIAKSRSVIKSI